MFTQNTSFDNKFFAESIDASKRGTAVSIRDMMGPRAARNLVSDVQVHDSNFAFLTTTLAKLHKELYEPLYFVTWQKDIPFETGGVISHRRNRLSSRLRSDRSIACCAGPSRPP